LASKQSTREFGSVSVEYKYRHDRTTESWEVVVVGKDVEPNELFR
jgi:hypothetical protein